ncbi:MAG TPA: sigma-70 family RNA polymerase sigma factor [Anaerolineales bacterium]|nr:sigma-70 family RNA polymerase sigma factor [Anaerolineales bacterium]
MSLQREIETALESLAEEKGMGLVIRIRSILSANLDRNRIQKFTEGKAVSVEEYIRRVVGNYERLNAYIHQLQIERSNEVWEPLLKNMRKWAYRFLVKKGYQANQVTWEHAKECANEAARSLLGAYFPYDTDFEPWARVVVQNACLKFLRSIGKEIPILEESLDDLEDTLRRFSGPVFRDEDRKDRQYSELFEAILQLSDLRRQVIEMKYFQNLSPSEIAEKLGRNVRAIHSLQFHALQDLRKILAQNRNKINE